MTLEEKILKMETLDLSFTKHLPQKKREKFMKSRQQILNSLKNEGWIDGAKRSALSGIHQGLVQNIQLKYNQEEEYQIARALDVSLSHGLVYKELPRTLPEIEKAWKYIKTWSRYPVDKKELITPQDIKAWIKSVDAILNAVDHLNSLRPKPTLTKILLSKKVTKTLKEMNLDIDIQSIRLPEFGQKEFDYISKSGTRKSFTYWFPLWQKGTKHEKSRFAGNGQCEACGKQILSRRFVPIEAFDKTEKETISLWLGQDCAKKIFGVKDIGVDKTPTQPKD